MGKKLQTWDKSLGNKGREDKGWAGRIAARQKRKLKKNYEDSGEAVVRVLTWTNLLVVSGLVIFFCLCLGGIMAGAGREYFNLCAASWGVWQFIIKFVKWVISDVNVLGNEVIWWRLYALTTWMGAAMLMVITQLNGEPRLFLQLGVFVGIFLLIKASQLFLYKVRMFSLHFYETEGIVVLSTSMAFLGLALLQEIMTLKSSDTEIVTISLLGLVLGWCLGNWLLTAIKVTEGVQELRDEKMTLMEEKCGWCEDEEGDSDGYN